MFGLHPAITAITFGLILGFVAYYLLGVRGRRQAESSAGIDALASRKWREFAHLVLEALRRDGYIEEDIERQPGDSGFDFVLSRDGQRFLLACKHGRAYRLGEQAIREFATATRMQGANGGVLVTLGQVEGFAREVANAHRIELIDGKALWQRVAPLLPADTRQHVAEHVDTRTTRHLLLGAAACVALSLAVFVLLEPAPGSSAVSATASVTGVQPAHPTRTVQPAVASALPPLPEDLDSTELSARRASALRQIGKLPNVGSATWSTRSTLVIALRDTPGGANAPDPVEESCRILVQYEELRFTRLQIDPAPGDNAPVRWRQCR